MSEFLIKSKHFTTKHIWFADKIDEIKGGARQTNSPWVSFTRRDDRTV